MPKVIDKAKAKREWLKAYQNGNITTYGAAAASAGISLQTFYNYRDEDEAFAARVATAKEKQDRLRLDTVEDILVRRIINDKAGQAVTIFWLKANGGEKYRLADQSVLHHKGGIDIVMRRRAADEELEKFEKEADADD